MNERTEKTSVKAPPPRWFTALAEGRAILAKDCSGGRTTGAMVRQFLTKASADPSVGNRVLSFCKVDIDGDIDLKGCSGLGYVHFDGCTIHGAIDMEGAEMKALKLDGSTVTSLKGTRARIRGSIYLRWGFTAQEGVDLSGSWIEGSLTFRGATLRPDNKGYCLKLRHTTVGGTLYLGPKNREEEREDPKAGKRSGMVVLDGSIDLSGLRVREFVDHREAYALIRRVPGRHIILDGFEYDRLGGLSPTDWRFRVRDWFSLQKDVWSCVGIWQCCLRLWEDLRTRPADPTGAATREPQFYPQPFERLARVLKDMGHDDDAKTVMYQKREAQHYFNLLQRPDKNRKTLRLWGDRLSFPLRWMIILLYGKIAGYGYRMGMLATVISVLVLVQIAGLSIAANARLIAPALLPAMNSDWWLNCRDSDQTTPLRSPTSAVVRGASDLNRCLRTEAGSLETHRYRDYPAFDPMIFGIEAFFPMLDLGQTSHWLISDRTAKGRLLSWWIAIYGILGWIATSLVVAGLFARFNQRGGD